MKKLNNKKSYDQLKVVGKCANIECRNDFTEIDEYLIDDFNLYCDSICYTKVMLKVGVVKEIKY